MVIAPLIRPWGGRGLYELLNDGRYENVMGACLVQYKKIMKLFFLGGVLVMLSGCRSYKLYHYEEIKDYVLGGELVIEVVATRQLMEAGGKKVAVEAEPYSLLFKFFKGEKFIGIEVADLVLTGVSTGHKINLSSSKSMDARLFSGTDRYFAIVAFSKKLEGDNLEHEPYDIDASLTLRNQDGSITKTDLKYRLQPEYKTDSRSDIIDGMMGI